MFVNELTHLVGSLLAGLIAWRFFGLAKLVFPAALLAGFFVDVDHWLDYWLAFGWDFDLVKFFQGAQFLASDRLFVFLHGWEHLVILVVIFFLWRKKIKEAGRAILLAMILAYGAHLTADSLMNDGLSFQSYSLIFRAKNDFQIEQLVTEEHWEKHRERR